MPGQYRSYCRARHRRPCRFDQDDPIPARLFLCARCRVQVAICSRCDRGHIYCAGADAYEAVVRNQVIPGIEARQIPGFLHIDLMRRDCDDDAVEFQTLMWFETMDAIHAFVGADAEVSHVGVGSRYG